MGIKRYIMMGLPRTMIIGAEKGETVRGRERKEEEGGRKKKEGRKKEGWTKTNESKMEEQESKAS